jgi:hypothetical protein
MGQKEPQVLEVVCLDDDCCSCRRSGRCAESGRYEFGLSAPPQWVIAFTKKMDQYLMNYLRELEDECGFNNENVAPNTRSRTGDTPIHIAAINGNLRAIALLIEEGVDLNTKGEGGMTPLHYAVQMQQIEAVKILLKHAADHTVADDSGDTPAGTARVMKNFQIEALLPKNPASKTAEATPLRSLPHL